MEEVARNNVFVYGEGITAPQIFFCFDNSEDKTAQKNFFALHEDKTAPHFF